MCDADDRICMDCGYNFETGRMPEASIADSIGGGGPDRNTGRHAALDQPAEDLSAAAQGVGTEVHRAPGPVAAAIIGGGDDDEPVERFGAPDAVEAVAAAAAETAELAAAEVGDRPATPSPAAAASAERPAFLQSNSVGPTVPDSVWKLVRPRGGPHLVIFVSREPRPGRQTDDQLPPDRDPEVFSLTAPLVWFGRAKPAAPNESYMWLDFDLGVGEKMPHGQFDMQLSGGYTLAVTHRNGAWVHRGKETIRLKPTQKPLRLRHGDVIAVGLFTAALYVEPDEDEVESPPGSN
jgi:hypothetical protein